MKATLWRLYSLAALPQGRFMIDKDRLLASLSFVDLSYFSIPDKIRSLCRQLSDLLSSAALLYI